MVTGQPKSQKTGKPVSLRTTASAVYMINGGTVEDVVSRINTNIASLKDKIIQSAGLSEEQTDNITNIINTLEENINTQYNSITSINNTITNNIGTRPSNVSYFTFSDKTLWTCISTLAKADNFMDTKISILTTNINSISDNLGKRINNTDNRLNDLTDRICADKNKGLWTGAWINEKINIPVATIHTYLNGFYQHYSYLDGYMRNLSSFIRSKYSNSPQYQNSDCPLYESANIHMVNPDYKWW